MFYYTLEYLFHMDNSRYGNCKINHLHELEFSYYNDQRSSFLLSRLCGLNMNTPFTIYRVNIILSIQRHGYWELLTNFRAMYDIKVSDCWIKWQYVQELYKPTANIKYPRTLVWSKNAWAMQRARGIGGSGWKRG